jgi:hypothetical protein
MGRPICAVIERLTGDTIELTLDTDMLINDVKSAISKELSISRNSFHLLVGTTFLKGSKSLATVVRGPEGGLRFSMAKVDPLPELGSFVFDHSHHQGLFVVNAKLEGDPSMLVKTAMYPDSSAANVFVRHRIMEPCFVEFRIIHAKGEMSFGVTHKPIEVLDAFGFSNRKLNCTWLYGRRSQAMATCLLGGVAPRLKEPEPFQPNDLITVYVNPEERRVQFYRNGQLVVDNLPKYPLPEVCEEQPLRMYAMVHHGHDEIHIQRCGPGEPFEDIVSTSSPNDTAAA